MVRISAVICTRNRAEYLRKAIRSLVEQSLPAGEYEILVVDNASTDDTPRVTCEEFKDVPNLRYIHEPIVGLSQARNTGWRNARGRYVAYLDDDATACFRWLEVALEAFRTVKPAPGCVGGKIDPVYPETPPAWIQGNLLHGLAAADWCDTPSVLGDTQWLGGGNCAYPRSLLAEAGGFSTALGRKDKNLLSNEEMLLHREIKSRGYICYYHPEMLIHHHVPAERLTKRWILRRAYWQGVSDAVLYIYRPDAFQRGRKFTVSEVMRRLCSFRSLSRLLLPTNDPERMSQKARLCWVIGWAVGSLWHRRGKSATKTIMLATTDKFWLDDRGDRRRIATLCRFMMKCRFRLEVFFVGQLDERDRNLMARSFRQAQFHVTNRARSALAGPTILERAIAALRRAAAWLLKRCLPAGMVRRLKALRDARRLRAEQRASCERGEDRNLRPTDRRSSRERRLGDFFSAENQREFRTLSKRVAPDAIIIECIILAYLVEDIQRYLPRPALTLIDAHNVTWERCRRFHEAGERHWIDITENEEKDVLERFDVIMAIQKSDAASFSATVPHRKVITVGHASEIIYRKQRDDSHVNLLYVASSTLANRRATEAFLEDVWPDIHRRFADKVRLVIGGSVCDYFDQSSVGDGVVLWGYIDDLDAIYREADIVINPVTLGGGLKIKNVEALCNGKPLVTTSVGAGGIAHGAGKAFYVCDTTEAMTEALSALIEDADLRGRFSEEAYRFAQENFTEDKAYAELYEALTSDLDGGAARQ